jgi:hypothetical protein
MDDYIAKFDNSIWKEASDLSCKHMSSLSMAENNNYRYNNNNIFNHPNFDTLCNYTDRGLELNILKGMFIDKKNCLNKKPEYNNGPWEKQFGIYNPLTETYGCDMKVEFDSISKAKMNNTPPCIPNVLIDNGKNKKLTTLFNNEYNNDITKLKEKSLSMIDRYNNHNPVIGDEFVRPPTNGRTNPEPVNDPSYKPTNLYLIPPIRNPTGTSDCSTLYNYDRYNSYKKNDLYFEPCAMPN